MKSGKCLPDIIFELRKESVVSKSASHFQFPDTGAEAATGAVLLKKVFSETSQNSKENTCVGVSFLIKLQA